MTDTRARAIALLGQLTVATMREPYHDTEADIETLASALADERRQALEEAAKVVQEYKLPTGESIAGDKMNRYLDGIAVDILAKAQAGPEEGKK